MSKRGTTLIESVIAIFIISVVLVTFLESLNVAITGTMQLTRKTSALNIAKSEIEYAKAQKYNASTGDINVVYGNISLNISDKINYTISGRVDNVSGAQALQAISVNVSYLPSKQVQLTAYKTADGSLTEPLSRGLLVTDNIKNVPILPAGSTDSASCGEFKGFYHVFETGPTPTGKTTSVTVTWKFYWYRVNEAIDISSLGAPMIAIYGPNASGEPPNWADRDYLGVVREDGIVYRGQSNLKLAGRAVGIGDLPGYGDSSKCHCWDESNCDCAGEDNPLAYAPHMCTGLIYQIACWLIGYTGNYPCCGACFGADGTPGTSYWEYDNSCGGLGLGPCRVHNGYVEKTLTYAFTINDKPGKYTVLFFNGENKIDLDTISASVTYWK